ncbi:hypothetical protein [Arenibacter palladensis]|nr:hypothetical protein [Arenibacter palladensis]
MEITLNGLGYDFGVENPAGFFMLGPGQVKCKDFSFLRFGHAEL